MRGNLRRAVAVLCDIHGNLPALEAVLLEIRQERVERIVVGGDVLPGPMPLETMNLLRELDLPVQFIHGNGDREVLAAMDGRELATVPEQFRSIVHWTAQQLSAEHHRELASWPLTLRVETAGFGDVFFCHATPRNDVDIFTRLTPEERLAPIFSTLGVPLVICGHTHMQFDRMVGGVRVMNAGSVGMPFGEPGADWLLLGPDRAELRRTRYDRESAAERVRATSYPQAEEVASRYILNPPTEQEMLDLFSPHELQ